MLKMTSETSNGIVKLAGIGLKVSGEKDGGVLVTLDLHDEIADEADALALEDLIPGAATWWRRAARAIDAGEEEEALNGAASGSQAATEAMIPGEVNLPTPSDHPWRLTLGAGDAVVEADAVARKARLKATAKGCHYALRMTLSGLDPTAIARLVGWLGSSTHASLRAVQAVLPFTRKLLAEVGEVASGLDERGRSWCGVVVSRGKDDDGDFLEIHDVDAGEGLIVRAAQISGAIRVEGADGSTRDGR